MVFLDFEKIVFFHPNFQKKSISAAKLSFDSAQILHANLFTLLVLDIVNDFDNFDLIPFLDLEKLAKIYLPTLKW